MLLATIVHVCGPEDPKLKQFIKKHVRKSWNFLWINVNVSSGDLHKRTKATDTFFYCSFKLIGRAESGVDDAITERAYPSSQQS